MFALMQLSYFFFVYSSMLFFQFIESNYLLSLSMRDMFMVKIIFLFLFFISGGYHVFSKTDSAGADKRDFYP